MLGPLMLGWRATAGSGRGWNATPFGIKILADAGGSAPALPGIGVGEEGEAGDRAADVVQGVARDVRVDRGRGRRAVPAVGVVRDQLAGALAGLGAVAGEVERAQVAVDAPALPGVGVVEVGAHVDHLAGAQVVAVSADAADVERQGRVERAAPAVGVAGDRLGVVMADVLAVPGEIGRAQVVRRHPAARLVRGPGRGLLLGLARGGPRDRLARERGGTGRARMLL